MKDAGYVCQLEKGRRFSALLLDSYLSQWWIELQLFYQLHKEQGSLASYSRASMAAVTKTNQETNLTVSALQAPHWETEKVASFTNSVLWNSFTVPKLHTSVHSCSKTLQEEDTWNPALGASTLYIIKTTRNKLTAAACFKFLPLATLLPSYCNSWIKEEFTLSWRQKSGSITWKTVSRNTVCSFPAVSGLFLSTNYSVKVYKFFKLHLLLNMDKVVTLRSKRNNLLDEAKDFSSTKAATIKPQVSQAQPDHIKTHRLTFWPQLGSRILYVIPTRSPECNSH